MRAAAIIVALVAVLLTLPAAHAEEAITLEVVTIAAGKLVITGTTAEPRAKVVIAGTSFNTRSNKEGLFSFNVNYLPEDCRVTLVASGDTVSALVSMCGPTGPQGKRGPTGARGPAGEAGQTGKKGSKTFKGSRVRRVRSALPVPRARRDHKAIRAISASWGFG